MRETKTKTWGFLLQDEGEGKERFQKLGRNCQIMKFDTVKKARNLKDEANQAITI